MSALEDLRQSLPEATARDIRVNLQTVLAQGSLSPAQRYGVAVAAAAVSRAPALYEAVLSEARGQAEPATIEDAKAAAVLMGMNNIYYRMKSALGGEYAGIPPRLRMQRLGAPASNKLDLELFSLAASAVLGCTHCLQAHEKVVREGGMTAEQVNDAVRIAATVHGAAVALGLGSEAGELAQKSA